MSQLPSWIPEERREGGGSCQLRDIVKKRVPDELERVQLLSALGELERYRAWHGARLELGPEPTPDERRRAREIVDELGAIAMTEATAERIIYEALAVARAGT